MVTIFQERLSTLSLR